MNKTRVYLFTGFLESGKSSFIQDTLLEQGFGEDEKTLIIACEEGEVAFDIPALEKENASVEFIENEEDLNYETLLHLHQKYQPTQVMIEYNGMWDNTKFVDEICIDQWQVVQILTTISAETFDLYYNNMRGQFVYHVTGSDLVIVNRCDENTKKYPIRGSIKSLNPMCQIVYENKNRQEALKLQEKYGLNSLISEILANREITTENAEIFLNPNRHDFHDPFQMPDMEKAVQRILKAIENKEKTIIFGDYDVDGITSSTVLKSFLKDRGLDVGNYIPNRLKEGYGLNKEAVEKIANENYTLMITVDCGITGNEEIEYAKTFGIETIVTDHHEPAETLPDALAVVDCKRKDNKYPFRELAGVGVAFKLAQAISIKMNLDEKEYLKYLDIVAIGTISDIVPLVDENRVITKLGLKLVRCTKNIGLKAILNEIRI